MSRGRRLTRHVTCFLVLFVASCGPSSVSPPATASVVIEIKNLPAPTQSYAALWLGNVEAPQPSPGNAQAWGMISMIPAQSYQPPITFASVGNLVATQWAFQVSVIQGDFTTGSLFIQTPPGAPCIAQLFSGPNTVTVSRQNGTPDYLACSSKYGGARPPRPPPKQ